MAPQPINKTLVARLRLMGYERGPGRPIGADGWAGAEVLAEQPLARCRCDYHWSMRPARPRCCWKASRCMTRTRFVEWITPAFLIDRQVFTIPEELPAETIPTGWMC